MRTIQFLMAVPLMAAASLALGQDPMFVDETTSRLTVDHQMGVRADAGDVDGDGDIDIIVANGQHTDLTGSVLPQDIMLQINDGDGEFTEEAASRLPSNAFGSRLPTSAILGDVNGDGLPDVFVAKGGSDGSHCPGDPADDPQNLLWINDHSNPGHFIDGTSLLPGISDCSLHAAFGDIDGDDDLDVVVANVGFGGLGEINGVLINDLDGSGAFIEGTSASLTSLPADITNAVALGDLDGDTDLDIVFGNAPGSAPLNRFLENNGGVFSDVTVSWTGFPPTDWPRPVWDVKLADMNGDGSLDVLLSDALDSLRMILMINQGAWQFTAQTIYVSYQYGFDVADVDNDGDRDIVVAQAAPAGFPLRLLLNSGASSPTFEDVSWGQLPEDLFWDTAQASIRFPELADVNDDGAVDIYIPTWVWWWNGWEVPDFQDRLLMNTLVPESQDLEVAIDIKFCSDPNAFNCKKKGVLPVTIFGTADFNVSSVDISTLRLCLDDLITCTQNAPVSWSMADRGHPDQDVGADQCELIEGIEQDYLTQDGQSDLDAAFRPSEVQLLLDDFCELPKNSSSPTLFVVGETLSGVPFTSLEVNDVAVDQLLKVNK